MSRQRRRHLLGRAVRSATLAGLVTALASGPVTVTAAESVLAAREFRTAVVVLNFNGAKYGLTPEKRDSLAKQHFGTHNYSLATFFEEASDGRVTFVPLPGKPQVLGAYEVTEPGRCVYKEGDNYTVARRAREALAADGIPSTAYHALAVHYVGWPGCPPAGWTRDGIKTATFGPTTAGLRHEFGHTLGLPHLSSVKCSGTLADCTGGGYRGSSPMGGEGVAGLAAPELLRLHWYRDSQVVRAPAVGTHTLTPLHATRETAGTRILEIPRGGQRKLIVSYRAKGTIDPNTNGVQLHISDGTVEKPYRTYRFVDPTPQTAGIKYASLEVGMSIVDPQSGLTIKTVSQDANGAVVEIIATP